MGEPAFTPGPWTLFRGGTDYLGIEAQKCSIVAFGDRSDAQGVRGRTDEEAEANARLIASAPLLFADAEFLCARLRELENELNDDHVARQFFGHVAPALARMEDALSLALGEKQDA